MLTHFLCCECSLVVEHLPDMFTANCAALSSTNDGAGNNGEGSGDGDSTSAKKKKKKQ